jgi:Xaa-Pro aminopeptidase
MNVIEERIDRLKKLMQLKNLSAYIIPSTDPHASEYVADFWKCREWISGFDGSAGTIVVTDSEVLLWTDSRYFIQAEEQIKGTSIQLMKQGLIDTPSISTWIVNHIQPNQMIGIDSLQFSLDAYDELLFKLNTVDIKLIDVDLISELWLDRPLMPLDPVFSLSEIHAGKSVSDKILLVKEFMDTKDCDILLITALDDIAWLLNARGSDVSYNPVFVSYVIVKRDEVVLFVDIRKITPQMMQYFDSWKVKVVDYQNVSLYVSSIKSGSVVMVDPSKQNQSLINYLPPTCSLVKVASPVSKLKAIKNEIEIAGFRAAMIRDGVALTRFFKFLDENDKSLNLTEMSVAEILKDFRAKQDLFQGESFGTIAAYASHGAIGHYSAKPHTNSILREGNLFLLDSGGQYLDGTTDITRTISFGIPSLQQKMDFTLVLKGLIALDSIQFPHGTKGHQLDVLARKELWNAGINYGHGTGHGVGHFLCVHEGPQGIRADENPTVLEVGMILSNEPGVYREGEYGIRTENLMLVVPSIQTEFANFLKFETLTLFPIEQGLIQWEMLSNEDINWLESYHEKVFSSLSPFLTVSEQEWLKQKCDINTK